MVSAVRGIGVYFLAGRNVPVLRLLTPMSRGSPMGQALSGVKMAPCRYYCSMSSVRKTVTHLGGVGFIPLVGTIRTYTVNKEHIYFLFGGGINLVRLMRSWCYYCRMFCFSWWRVERSI